MYPFAWSRGTNGCNPAKPLKVIGIIEIAELSFIVQEPREIIELVRETSFSQSLWMYLIILVSENFILNWFSCMNGEVLFRFSGRDLYCLSSYSTKGWVTDC